MLATIFSKGRSNRAAYEADGVSTAQLLDWLYYHTEWAGDFDQETHSRTILKIWEAENIPGQKWIVSCKRRRRSNGIGRLHKIQVAEMDGFPSRVSLEILVLSKGYGGGDYYLTSTRGRKVA